MSYVKGEIVYKLYFDNESKYSVYKVKIDETDTTELSFNSTCSITGYFPELEKNGSYEFNGSIIESKKYGYTFSATSAQRILPSSKDGIIEFLSGDTFKGIGLKKAKDIVETLGNDCLKLIKEDNRILDKVKSLTEINKQSIIDGLINSKEIEEILVKLYSYGVSPKFAIRIYDKYKKETLNVIKDNPYQLIDDIEGIAFLRADKIALQTGVNPKSLRRIESCVSYTLYNYSCETGNTLIDEDKLKDIVKKQLDYSYEDNDLIGEAINNLKLRRKIVVVDNTLSDFRIYYAEDFISKKLTELNKVKTIKPFEEEVIKLIHNLEKELDIVYESTQIDAIINALNNNVSIITGGPGTGKTTIEKGIIYCYTQLVSNDLNKIALCAPTGKASKRIEESTGYFSQTIHRTLGFDRMGNFTYNKFNHLAVRLVVVDEASMIDSFLFERLLEALDDDCKIVIVGDSDQLPSIGPGQVLKDLIDSNAFTVTKLTKIHRQKKNSKIISLAYDILDEDIKTELDENHEELEFIKSTPNDLIANIKNTIDHFSGLGYSLLNDIQVLIPMYKGQVGIEAVNQELQRLFNPNYLSNETGKIQDFFLDDKVIQLVNQYEDSVMNGDMGFISDILGKKELIANFQGNEVEYKGSDISNLQLAYSISIHKSQGSEFKIVILPLFPSYMSLLNKKLLYTAVTRAKDYLVIIGDPQVLNRSIRIMSLDRKTRLKEML